MSVNNGEKANETTFNNAFLSRKEDSDTIGKIDLNNIDTPAITDVQATMNQQRTDIDQNRTDIDSNDVDIAALDGRLTTAEGDIDALETDYVSKTLPQTVAGTKTFSDPTIVSNTTTSTSKDTGALVVDGGVGIEENLNVGGNVVVTGDLQVDGTTTTVNSATLDVTDANVTVNNGGNDVSAEGAGLTVERTGTDGSLVYEDALEMKFKAGSIGAEIELGGVIRDTEANILALGSPLTSVYYKATDTGKTFFYDSVNLAFKEVGAGGGGTGVGSPDTLFVDNGDDSEPSDFTFDGWSISATDSINGTNSFVGVHDAALNKTMQRNAFPVPPKFQGKNLNITLDANSGASTGNVTLTVRDETNAVDLISEQISLVNDLTKSVKSSFTFDCPANCVSMSYIVTALPEAGAPETRIDDITLKLNKRETTEISQVKQETNVFSAKVNNSGTASIASQSEPFISSVTRSAPGVVDVVFQAGFFTEAPIVTLSVDGVGVASFARISSTVTVSGFSVNTTDGTSEADRDFSFDVHRQGSDYKDQTVSVEREQSTFHEVIVEEADSIIHFVSDLSESSNFSGNIFSIDNAPAQLEGSAITYNKDTANGDTFTVEEDGFYTINASILWDATVATGYHGFTRNQTDLSQGINTSLIPDTEYLAQSSKSSSAFGGGTCSWSGPLKKGDIIRWLGGSAASVQNGIHNTFTMAKVGIPKIASVAPESKVKIPTSELRMEGLSGLGTGSEARTVRYSSISKIRGDGFTVDNSNATIITIKKNGVFSISASVEAGSANRTFHITKNATNPTAAPNQDEILSTAVEETGTHSLNLSSGQISVVAGDEIRVYSDGTSTVLNHSLQAFHQEQEIQVAVSNVTPQYEDADSMVRLSGPFSYGSVNTYGIRLSSLEQSIGDDIDYFDNPDNGAEFTIKTSGYYSLSGLIYFNSAAHGFGVTVNRNYIGDIAEVDSTDVLQSAYQVSNPSLPSLSWSGYLNEGDVLRIIAHKNTGVDGGSYLPDGDPGRNTWTSFTIAKVGVPSIAEVDVTPFVDLQDQGWKVNSLKLEGNDGQSVTANTTDIPFSGGGKGWNGSSYTVQNNDAIIELKLGLKFTGSLTSTAEIYKNGTLYKNIISGVSTSQPVASFISSKGEFVTGDVLTIRVGSSLTLSDVSDAHYLNINEWYRADQYERIYAVEQNENEFSALVNGSDNTGQGQNTVIASQSLPFIDSITTVAGVAHSDGAYRIDFIDGFFTEIPSVNFTPFNDGGSNRTIHVEALSLNSCSIQITNDADLGAFEDFSIHVSRQGADRKDLQRQLASISDFPRVNNQLYQSLNYVEAQSSMLDRVGEVRFTTNISSAFIGDSILVAEDDAANTRTKFTALRDCVVNISFSFTYSSGVGLVYKNGIEIQDGDKGGVNDESLISSTTTLKKGEFLSVGTSGAIANTAYGARISITAQAQELERVDSVERVENVFSAVIDAGATITTQSSNFIESVSSGGAGVYNITFKSGFFTVAPAVTVTASGREVTMAPSVTTSGCTIHTRNSSSVPANDTFRMMVQRQGSDYKLLSDVVVAIPEAQVAIIEQRGNGSSQALTTSYATLAFNTLTDDGGFLSFDNGTDRFTVPAGEYIIDATLLSEQLAAAYGAIYYKLVNVTDTIDYYSIPAYVNTNNYSQARIYEKLTLTKQTTFEIQGRKSGGGTANFGHLVTAPNDKSAFISVKKLR